MNLKCFREPPRRRSLVPACNLAGPNWTTPLLRSYARQSVGNNEKIGILPSETGLPQPRAVDQNCLQRTVARRSTSIRGFDLPKLDLAEL